MKFWISANKIKMDECFFIVEAESIQEAKEKVEQKEVEPYKTIPCGEPFFEDFCVELLSEN